MGCVSQLVLASSSVYQRLPHSTSEKQCGSAYLQLRFAAGITAMDEWVVDTVHVELTTVNKMEQAAVGDCT